MTERSGGNSKSPLGLNDEQDRLLKSLAKGRMRRHAINFVFRAALRARGGREATRSLRDPAATTGLLAGAALAPTLVYPDFLSSELTKRHAAPGRWIGYDFRAFSVFGKEKTIKYHRHLQEGRLLAFMLEEIKDAAPEHLTPTGIVQIANLEHIMQAELLSIEEAMQKGVIFESTYAALYGAAGNEHLVPQLEAIGIAHDQLYGVTPKGNGIIYLMSEGDAKRPAGSRDRVAAPEFLPGLVGSPVGVSEI